MFLVSVINAKVHLVSGLVIGGLLVATAGQMKCIRRYSDRKCNTIQSSSDNSEN